ADSPLTPGRQSQPVRRESRVVVLRTEHATQPGFRPAEVPQPQVRQVHLFLLPADFSQSVGEGRPSWACLYHECAPVGGEFHGGSTTTQNTIESDFEDVTDPQGLLVKRLLEFPDLPKPAGSSGGIIVQQVPGAQLVSLHLGEADPVTRYRGHCATVPGEREGL